MKAIVDLHEYESRLNRPQRMKVGELQRFERLKHIIFSDQYSKGMLDHLCRTATMIKEISSTRQGNLFLKGLLEHKRAMLYFTQASTRTFLSFMAACQILGITCNEIRDPSVSSEYKGESPFDSVRMFSSYFDMIIMRSKIPAFAECCAYLMNDLEAQDMRNVPIINGGAGADEHPTQALLDIYTIQLTFAFSSKKDSSKWSRFDELRKKYPSLTRGLDNKTYCFVGDIGRGRTVRSLAKLLALYQNVKMVFVSPDHSMLKLPPEMENWLVSHGVKVSEAKTLDEIIDKVDLVYMTRVQHEHNVGDNPFAGIDFAKFHLTPELVARMKDYAPILHPFPRNEEIPHEVDNDPRAMYFRQARNGMWARAALIAYLFDADGKIASYFNQEYSEYHDYNQGVL